QVGPVTHQAAGYYEISCRVARRNLLARCQRDYLIAPDHEICIGGNEQSRDMLSGQRLERPCQLALRANLQDKQPSSSHVGGRPRVFRIALSVGIVWVHKHAKRRRAWLSSSSRLETSLFTRKLTPVIFPPGRLRLGTSPSSTGSPPVRNTIGSIDVAGLA